MIGTLGGPELILILVIALIVFGPRKLPEIGKSIGKMMVEFRRASADFKRTVEEEVEAEKRKPAPRIAAPGPAAPPRPVAGPDAGTPEDPASDPKPRPPEEGAPEARQDTRPAEASPPADADAAPSETP